MKKKGQGLKNKVQEDFLLARLEGVMKYKKKNRSLIKIIRRLLLGRD